ncbi:MULTISPECIES: GNAT family N-acetyltransferase [Clostridium]|uniref:Acetyltransferase, GNAT family, putative n=2 Tax=Clostridium novyi TaxID=1542 RepID=A0Q0H0_CLONN|nr:MULTISPECIES: GNAT family N-acetyltransferase [Clostridium]ABK61540.1 acetyltransferase, GNAT family, putative [Clostridium novyi NT]KEH85076.1 GNAT family acetyltransferase [Clostridium novyi A str. NCTC 538]KEH90648.1 GNAT family acetyltransferase [Clostridium botulinum C/D str. It1]KEH90718.1 GNAT family acetyltransferase [Clostridium novyi A str. GD211209]
MKFRKSTKSDITNILEIIFEAQNYFKKHNIDQWQDGYPNFETIDNDINKGYGYVLVKDEIILGTVALSFDKEESYTNIYDGKWLSNENSAVIHRIAISNKLKGNNLASVIIKHIEDICLNKNIHSIKIDTHEDNISMQKLLYKNNFKYCGVVYLEDNSKRIAFEKLI